MQILSLDTGIFVFEQEFADTDVRGVLILGQRCAVIFDPLVDPTATAKLLPMIGARELSLVYSHADWDHVWGSCLLGDIPIVAHKRCGDRFADPLDVAATLKSYQSSFPQLQTIRLCAPTNIFEERTSLDLGGITLDLIHCPGHTSDSIIALIPERGILLAGDCVETPLPLIDGNCAAVPEWIEVLRRYESDSSISMVIPSHGDIGGRSVLSQTREYLEALLQGDCKLSGELGPFYAEAHQSNLRIVAIYNSVK